MMKYIRVAVIVGLRHESYLPLALRNFEPKMALRFC